jgi:hypothetical protein
MISGIRLRRWHAYIGSLLAPSVLFFCLTGALQIFNLHEAHGSYRPAVLVAKLSAVHKDQVFEEPDEHAEHSSAAAAPAPEGSQGPAESDDAKVGAATLALKWFFLVVALGLTVSTLIGVWVAITQTHKTRLVWTLLIAGTLVPVGLLLAG